MSTKRALTTSSARRQLRCFRMTKKKVMSTKISKSSTNLLKNSPNWARAILSSISLHLLASIFISVVRIAISSNIGTKIKMD
jgi:hypothetical protein